jgi:hypothetical protein
MMERVNTSSVNNAWGGMGWGAVGGHVWVWAWAGGGGGGGGGGGVVRRWQC